MAATYLQGEQRSFQEVLKYLLKGKNNEWLPVTLHRRGLQVGSVPVSIPPTTFCLPTLSCYTSALPQFL